MNDEFKEKLKREIEQEEAMFDQKFPSIHFKIRKMNRISKIFFKLFMIVTLAGIIGGMVTELSIKSKYNEIVNTVHERLNSSESLTSYQKVISKVRKSIVSIGENENNLRNNIYSNKSSTGIVIDKYNKIITSYSNIKDLDDIYVKLPTENNIIVKAELIIGDEDLDIAIIQVSIDHELEPVTFASNENLLAGDTSILVSNSTGDEYIDSIIPGVITSINRSVTIGKYNNIKLLELNTNINEFNKSGGIFNLNGELIGIANNKITEKINNDGLYYAIGNNLIYDFNDSINKVKDYIGIIEGGFVESANEESVSGFYIERINTNSNAYNSGLRPTDIIYEIENIKITSMNKMYLALKDKKNNEIITCKVFKNGEIKEIQIKVQK